MCLAVPGKIIDIKPPDDNSAMGSIATVDFQGSQLEVSLAMIPKAKLGDWVLVHAGFALNTLDEDEARETWQYLKAAGIVDSTPPQTGEK